MVFVPVSSSRLDSRENISDEAIRLLDELGWFT